MYWKLIFDTRYDFTIHLINTELREKIASPYTVKIFLILEYFDGILLTKCNVKLQSRYC